MLIRPRFTYQYNKYDGRINYLKLNVVTAELIYLAISYFVCMFCIEIRFVRNEELKQVTDRTNFALTRISHQTQLRGLTYQTMLHFYCWCLLWGRTVLYHCGE